jgi:hypothetical protein
MKRNHWTSEEVIKILEGLKFEPGQNPEYNEAIADVIHVIQTLSARMAMTEDAEIKGMEEQEILRLSLIKINTKPHEDRQRLFEVRTIQNGEETLISRGSEADLLTALQAFLNRINN